MPIRSKARSCLTTCSSTLRKSSAPPYRSDSTIGACPSQDTPDFFSSTLHKRPLGAARLLRARLLRKTSFYRDATGVKTPWGRPRLGAGLPRRQVSA
jgi:hypothetical protein